MRIWSPFLSSIRCQVSFDEFDKIFNSLFFFHMFFLSLLFFLSAPSFSYSNPSVNDAEFIPWASFSRSPTFLNHLFVFHHHHPSTLLRCIVYILSLAFKMYCSLPKKFSHFLNQRAFIDHSRTQFDSFSRNQRAVIDHSSTQTTH